MSNVGGRNGNGNNINPQNTRRNLFRNVSTFFRRNNDLGLMRLINNPNTDIHRIVGFATDEARNQDVRDAAADRLINTMPATELTERYLFFIGNLAENPLLRRDVHDLAVNRLIMVIHNIELNNRSRNLIEGFQTNLSLPDNVRNAAAGRLRGVNTIMGITIANAPLTAINDSNNNLMLDPNNIPELNPNDDIKILNKKCPITQEIPENPIYIIDKTNQTAHQFEWSALETWFNTGHNTNPMTNQRITSDMLRKPRNQED